MHNSAVNCYTEISRQAASLSHALTK